MVVTCVWVDEMSDRQLKGLLKQNPDPDPYLLAAMCTELAARKRLESLSICSSNVVRSGLRSGEK